MAMTAHRRDMISEGIAMDRQVAIDAAHESPSRTPATRSRDYDPTLLGGGSVVPYIGSWTGEETQHHPVIRRPEGGIGFADETLIDRDEWGVLWSRTVARIGAGRPLFKDLHPRRQRRAMLRLLCQVCAQPADRTEQGSLWLVPGSDIGGWDDWPEGMCTIYPPLCEHCARLSVRMCPALRTHCVALRARSRICGVSGLVFQPRHPFPRLAPTDYDDVVPFGHPAIAWTLATQQARTLIDATVLNLEQL